MGTTPPVPLRVKLCLPSPRGAGRSRLASAYRGWSRDLESLRGNRCLSRFILSRFIPSQKKGLEPNYPMRIGSLLMLDFYSRFLNRFGFSIALYLTVALGAIFLRRFLGIPISAVPWVIGGAFIVLVLYQLIVVAARSGRQ